MRALRPPQGRVIVSLGWFGLVAGVAGWIWSENYRRHCEPWIIVTVAGFALLALPIVWREVEGTRAARQVQ